MGNKISKKERQRLEAEAQKKAKKKDTWSFMIMCVALVAIMWGVGYLINGSELANPPAKKQVVSVEVTAGETILIYVATSDGSNVDVELSFTAA